MLISPLYSSQPAKQTTAVSRYNRIIRKRKIRLATEAAFLMMPPRIVKNARFSNNPNVR